MRVLAFVEYFPPVLGHDRRIFEILRRAARLHEVHFAVLPALRELVGFQESVKSNGTDKTNIRAWTLRLPRRLNALWRRAPHIAFLPSILALFVRTCALARRIRPDVVVANYPSPYTGLLAYLVGRLQNKPLIVDFCDDIAAYFSEAFGDQQDSATSLLLEKVQSFLIRQAAGLPVVSRTLREQAVEKGVDQGRIVIVPNGVDIEAFAASATKFGEGEMGRSGWGGFRCFYGGSVEPWAGSDLIVNLAKLTETSRPEIEFLIAGNPQRIQARHPPGNVRLLGLLDRKTVADWIARSDIVLVPFRPGKASDAASPLKLFEGLAAGKPCVCSNTEGMREIITSGENGVLVDSLEPEAWLRAIGGLLDNPEKRRFISKNAMRLAVGFDWSEIASKFTDVLLRATSG